MKSDAGDDQAEPEEGRGSTSVAWNPFAPTRDPNLALLEFH